jgi:CBS domain-containing protein
VSYLSELIDKQVTDVQGESVGKLVDVIATKSGTLPHPMLAAILVKSGRQEMLIPLQDVAVLIAPAIPLKKTIKDIKPFSPKKDDLYLVRDVLDRQIIDTNGVRVVRVNDVEIGRVEDSFYVTNVDVGGMGLLRRLGLGKSAQRLAGRFKKGVRSPSISWDHVELLAPQEEMRLKVPGDKMADLHPADLAEIISDLNHNESGRLLDNMDTKRLADTLEEVEPDFQASLVRNMPDEKVADVLEEMEPDEAADLLAELPKERSEDLLELMEDDEAQDVKKLLEFPENSAGGIMTTDYIALPADITAAEAIRRIRKLAEEFDTFFYIYVVDKQKRLIGVFSLRDLILAAPGRLVKDFMHKRVQSVTLLTPQDEVAQVIAKYDLLSVPVIDEHHILHGMVTSDDALDKIIPTAWKKRLPRFFY